MGLLATEDARIRWNDRELNEIAELLADLFKVHAVEQGNWFGLTLMLANEHVPGFSMEKAGRGPKRVWGEYERAELRLAVDELIKAGTASSVFHACQILFRGSEWAQKVRTRSKNPTKALERQYHKANHRLTRIIESARAYDQWRSAHPDEAADLEREIANKLPAGKDS